MAKPRMKAITMTFKEIRVDQEGNVIKDKETGEPLYKRVRRNVRHNAYYFPRK